MPQLNGKRKRRESGSLQPGHPTTRGRRDVEIASSHGNRLCSACRAIDFDEIFRMEVNSCGKLVSRGCRVRALSHIRHGATCELCHFFRELMVSPRDSGSRLELCAYSARAAFGIPKGIIPDTVMLAVIPARRSKDPKEHPLSCGRVVMECADDQERITGRRIGAQVDFGLVKSWLDFCSTHHSQLCQRRDVASIPHFRVIDCSTREVVLWSDLQEPPGFAALSYVWGDKEDDCPVAHGHLPPNLPRLVENAIEVASKLGFGYLWIDRYCIPQDSAEEKHTQIQKMNLIYGSAAVTIIAAAGMDPTYGLPGVGSTPRAKQSSIRIGSRTLVCTNLDIARQVYRSKWVRRGWTYQEALLSKRRLVFTDQMVYFQCNAMHCLETISAPLKPLHTKDYRRMRELVNISRLWPLRGVGKYAADLEVRIMEYAMRELSHPSDALNAFEGILSEFKAMDRPVRNLCGVPIFDSNDITASLVVGLSWWVDTFGDASPRPCLRKRPGFPSWSWASWNLSTSSLVYLLNFNIHHDTSWEKTMFRQDKSTLKHTVPLVDIDMQMTDGTILKWTQTSDQIIEMVSSGRSLIDLLHVTGFTVDARAEKPTRYGKWDAFRRYTSLLNATDDAPSFLNRSDLCSWSLENSPYDVVTLAEAMGVHSRPADGGKHFFDLRFILLGYMEDGELNDKPCDRVMIMVVHRPEGSAAYERIAVIRTTSFRGGRMLRKMQQSDVRGFAGWKKCKTQIA